MKLKKIKFENWSDKNSIPVTFEVGTEDICDKTGFSRDTIKEIVESGDDYIIRFEHSSDMYLKNPRSICPEIKITMEGLQ